MVVGFGLYGIDPGKALIPSVFLGFATAVAALPGGCLWLNIRHASTRWLKAGARQLDSATASCKTRLFEHVTEPRK